MRSHALLAAYDVLLERCSTALQSELHLSGLNYQRSEILGLAINAFMMTGPLAYPAASSKLSELVDALSYAELSYLLFPDSLEQLVDCGILPHLPASPYSTGSYLNELPEIAQPGDVFYLPIPIQRPCWHREPGCHEGELLLIFDRSYDGNKALLDAEGLAEGSYGDYTKYFKPEQYDNICYILLNDRDEAENAKPQI